MNIVLMIFDSLRKDCVGVYGSPPWGKVQTPHLDAFAEEALVMTRAFPESLPTLPARRAIYTGNRVYPFRNGNFQLKGDFTGSPGWGPIPEDQHTLAEILRERGYRTALMSDVYHMFKPSKNFWRGFDQWTFLRGQEMDKARSGPRLSEQEVEYWLPDEVRSKTGHVGIEFIQQCIMNMRGRLREEDYFSPQVLKTAAQWLEENRDADRFFLTIESFDPHEPWLPPLHYRDMYVDREVRQQVVSAYSDVANVDEELLRATRANYSGEVTMCDRWFGYLIESLRVLGLLEDTLVILTSDHGHSIGDGGYMGKRGYPSAPEVYCVPLLIRFPRAEHAGKASDLIVQHHDISAAILEAADTQPPRPLHGISFLDAALNGKGSPRDHATIGWGSSPTVITERWWFNCKADGTGILLHDLDTADAFATNVADEYPDVVNMLFAQAQIDAGGEFPEWIVNLARDQADAPGCSDLAARERR